LRTYAGKSTGVGTPIGRGGGGDPGVELGAEGADEADETDETFELDDRELAALAVDDCELVLAREVYP